MRLAALILVLLFCLVVTATAFAVPTIEDGDDGELYFLYLERLAKQRAKEKKLKRLRKLKARYTDWRAWRKGDIRWRCHAWAVHEYQIRVRETANNVVPRYDVNGYQWCARFVQVCVEHAEPGRPMPSNPLSTSSWREAIRNHRCGLRPVWSHRMVRPGDVVCFPRHMGIFHRATKGGFWSIEGNVSNCVGLRWHRWYEADTFGRLTITRVPDRFDKVRNK